MKKSVKCILAVSLIFALFTANTSLAFAASPASVAPQHKLLLKGKLLSNDEMRSVEGEGFLATIGSAVSGGLAGFGGYTLSYLWNNYVEDDDMSWDWGDCGERVVNGMVTGAIVATVSAWWAP